MVTDKQKEMNKIDDSLPICGEGFFKFDNFGISLTKALHGSSHKRYYKPVKKWHSAKQMMVDTYEEISRNEAIELL